jgi:hypothetical protein
MGLSQLVLRQSPRLAIIVLVCARLQLTHGYGIRLKEGLVVGLVIGQRRSKLACIILIHSAAAHSELPH